MPGSARIAVVAHARHASCCIPQLQRTARSAEVLEAAERPVEMIADADGPFDGYVELHGVRVSKHAARDQRGDDNQIFGAL